MDGEKSFYPHSQGIEYLLNESKVAFMETGDVIRSVNKVETIWFSYGIPLHWDTKEMLTFYDYIYICQSMTAQLVTTTNKFRGITNIW